MLACQLSASQALAACRLSSAATFTLAGLSFFGSCTYKLETQLQLRRMLPTQAERVAK